jgi:hypothetical protein
VSFDNRTADRESHTHAVGLAGEETLVPARVRVIAFDFTSPGEMREASMSIKSGLRKLSYKEATMENVEEYQRQVTHETNDRGACILMATNVELALNSAIFRALEWDEETRGHLTSSEGPVATFAQKVHLGRALRIYGTETQHNLDYIGLIRNAFAHSHAPISFETKEIKDAVELLKQLKPLPPVATAACETFQTTEIASREAFRRICDITGRNLMIWGISGLHKIMLEPGEIRPQLPQYLDYAWRKPLP